MKGPLFALNPYMPDDKITVISEWCNEHSNNHYSLLYAASSLTLEGLLYQFNQVKINKLGELIYTVAPTDKHRFLAVTLALKALVSVYRLPVMWLSEYAISNPAVPIEDINNLALTCRQKVLTPEELLDVALCRASVEELIVSEGEGGETAQLNCDLLVEAADAGKIVGQELRGQPMEDRAGLLLGITLAMCGNILGKCGKAS